jgi:protein-L-isoaspartate(D-aspartate) O-methyltransferase
MPYIDFISDLHQSVKRDYLARVNNPLFPKHVAAELAKKWSFDYWDGDRAINYGGYKYIEGRWEKVAKKMVEYYNLKDGDKILDIGCGKGYLLYDFLKINPNLEVYGIDISSYAIYNSVKAIQNKLIIGNATNLPWPDKFFDFAFSIGTFHNLYNFELELALKEMQRISNADKYICVESYRNELEKSNLLYWQVTCEAFCTPKEWEWWFKLTGYTGDYSFIYFE